MSSFDDFVKKHTTFLENEYVAGTLTLFLIVYASMAAQRLPSYISNLFTNSVFKVIMFFLIVYMYNKKASVALVSAIALMVALMLLEKVNVQTTEKMTPLTNNNQNDLFANLTNLINDALDLVTSPDGQIAMDETTRAVQEGQLHPADAEMIINKIILAEEHGTSPLVAMSDQGAQQMASIAEAVANGKIAAEDGQRMAAKIVIQENVLSVGQEQVPPQAEQEKQMLAEEVKIQQQNIEDNTGTKMTQIQLRQLCAQIENDYYNQKMNEMSVVTGLTEFSGFDDYAPLY